MERSTARVFAVRQKVQLRAVSGCGTKVESALVFIPGYNGLIWGTGAVSRYKAECEPVIIPGYCFGL
jgi:hypothetical protein